MKLQEGQRVRLIQAPDGWNTASIRGGGSLPLHGQQGTVTDVSEALARVKVDDGPQVLVDRASDPRVELLDQVVVDLSRSEELLGRLDRFAQSQNLTRAEALVRLADRALDGV